jgi:two-component system sensor kinase FixL
MEQWCEPLRCWVRFISRSAAPTTLFWGQHRILLFNDAFAGVLGDDVRAALGQPIAKLSPDLAKAISPYVEDGFAGNSNSAEDVELPITTGENKGFVFSFTYTPIFGADANDAPLGVLCSLIDRTAKLASERRVARELHRLHEIYEHAPGFIAMSDGPEHRFSFANAAYRELVGRQDVIGKTVAEVLPEIVAQGFVAILDRVYETGVPFVGRGLPIELQPGPGEPPRKRYIDTIYHPLRDVAGKIVGLFAEGHDVTQQVEAQGLANKLQAQLLRVSRTTAMESFGSAVAHEINQPLAAAVNYLGLAKKLASDLERPDLSDAIGNASNATMRAGDILRRLRTLTTTGLTTPRPTNLTTVALEAITLVRMANPELSIITRSMEDCMVMADGVQVQQVLVNLLKNAQEAMTEVDHPEVSISIERHAESAVVRVEDRGEGIPPENLVTLFEWFVTTKDEGSGIGLPISRRIVESFGGKLTAENVPEGAAFTFTLPLAAPEEVING